VLYFGTVINCPYFFGPGKSRHYGASRTHIEDRAARRRGRDRSTNSVEYSIERTSRLSKATAPIWIISVNPITHSTGNEFTSRAEDGSFSYEVKRSGLVYKYSLGCMLIVCLCVLMESNFTFLFDFRRVYTINLRSSIII
jgi:hypothetical protein